nr:hypothetical protein [Candidatus Njordarchaeota archaeon]
MRRRSILVIAILACLVLPSMLATSAVSAQNGLSDCYSIKVILVEGNASLPNRNENFSNTETFLRENNPDLGSGLNLTVRSDLSSVDTLNGIKLLIVSMPVATTFPNTTILQEFLHQGGSLLLMSNYDGGGSRNSSEILNSILKETYVRNVSFGEDAISISNSTLNWQEKVYKNNTLAIRVNSSMFQLKTEARSLTNDVSQVIVLSCSLNMTSHDNATLAGTARAPLDPNLPNWLLLFDNGTNRIALCGSASMFNNTYLNAEGNQILFKNLILWLVEKFQMPGPDVFPYFTLISSAVLVSGLFIYISCRKRRV